MTKIFEEKTLKCNECPFISCDERDSCYICCCYLDDTIEIDHFCDYGGHPDQCPLITGLVLTIKEENGKLLIGKDYI